MKKFFSIMSKKTMFKCAGVVALAFASSMLASIWPVKLGQLYSDISSGAFSSASQALLAVMSFGMICISAEGLAILRRLVLDCVVTTHEAELRERSIAKFLKMPVAYCTALDSGTRAAQLKDGIDGCSKLLKIMCNDVFSTVMTALFTLGQVFFNAPVSMVGIMLVYLALSSVVSWFQIRSQNGMRERIIQLKNVMEGQICQSIQNLELIRSMSAETYESARLHPSISNISRTEKSHHRCMGMFDGLKKFCKIGFHLIILAASVLLIANGRMSAGSVITVCLLFEQLVRPIDDVYRFMDETASSVIKAKALFELLLSPADEIFDIQSSGAGVDDHAIRIKDLVIVGPKKDDKEIAWFDDIVIHEGTITALTGQNGCGKSSLIKCLNRYYPHIRGTISLFGREQQSYSQKELTDVLYYTPQKSIFVSGTVRDNLLYGLDRKVDDHELIAALKSVYLTGTDGKSVICSDPKKVLDCPISEINNELSGGMQQRLSLARVFLRRPRMFVFDEITANLDDEAADAVLSNIEAYAGTFGAGIVYISHASKVVDRCSEKVALRNRLRERVEEKQAA